MASPPTKIEHEWEDATTPLPSKRDFDARDNNLDALCAWSDFGNLTRNQAYEKFLEMPDRYQEHFMFMGWVAFVFYYPIVERYLVETHAGSVTSFL